MRKGARRKRASRKARGSLLEVATQLTQVLSANDWPVPFEHEPQEDEWRSPQNYPEGVLDWDKPWIGIHDPERSRKVKASKENHDRHWLWEAQVRWLLNECRRHVNAFGNLEQMRRFEGNVLWQILVAHGDNRVHRMAYFKDQCLADLESLALLVSRINPRRTLGKTSKFAGRLKKARIQRGESQEEAAKATRMTQPEYSMIETAAREPTDIKREKCEVYIKGAESHPPSH